VHEESLIVVKKEDKDNCSSDADGSINYLQNPSKQRRKSKIVTKISISNDQELLQQESGQFISERDRFEKLYEPNSTDKPYLQNNMLNGNPYLNIEANKIEISNRSESLKCRVDVIKKSNHQSKQRNLGILSRNLRNISYLKSPNPMPGATSQDRVLNLKYLTEAMESQDSNHSCFSWIKNECPQALNSTYYRNLSTHQKDLKTQEFRHPINLSSSTIINRYQIIFHFN
jgi:hypothetical protein